MDRTAFKEKLELGLYQIGGKSLDMADDYDLYTSLGMVLRELIGKNCAKINKRDEDEKRISYLSMEYLPGRLMKKNLLYLGLYETANSVFKEIGRPLDDILSVENDPGLGNGGLGRLAASFLDSMVNQGVPGIGYGLRYESGYFNQSIIEGFQREVPDNWLEEPYIWEYRRRVSFEVRFGGNVEIHGSGQSLEFKHVNYERVKAVCFDIPYLGYKKTNVNFLRLWSAQTYEGIDYNLFAGGYQSDSFLNIDKARAITQFLYPNDTSSDGKKLRLKQEYFLASAAIQDIVKEYMESGKNIKDLYLYRNIHLNDTQPSFAIPELMRILLDEHGLPWVEAWNIVVNTFTFTNYMILKEKMEIWDIDSVKEILPRIWLIIEEINHRFVYELKNELNISDYGSLRDLSIIEDNYIKMVNLSLAGSYSINGVGDLHTSILKSRLLKDFYGLFPESFSDIISGTTHRRWVLGANELLSKYLSEKIGPGFILEPKELIKLLDYQEDLSTLRELNRIKHENKIRLSNYIMKKQGIKISPYALFDVHIEKIHEYKRQLLNILHVIQLYHRLKENPNLDVIPRVFIFGGKAAYGHYAAKEIIRLIISVSNTINRDFTIKEKLKVVFIEDLNVSKAEIIIPAADVSEQISTPTKEAPGTENIQLMMNGAISLASLDGTNMEIAREVGEENIILFGLKDYEIYEYTDNNSYNPREIYYKDRVIRQVVDSLIQKDGIGFGDFRLIYDLLTKYNDSYFILKDFQSYRKAQDKINILYRSRERWSKMSLINIANSGKFSSDYTVRKYAEEIWRL